MPNWISCWIVNCFNISNRLKASVGWYLVSLMVEAPKHSLHFAASLSGMHRSQFSRLLKKDLLAKESLLLLSKKIGKTGCENREILIPGTKWTILLIIDSTLHRRSSIHVKNSQRFNHGTGYKIGHQWTNFILKINEKIIPLSPIPFFSKKECRRRGVTYKTEHERINEVLRDLDLTNWVGIHSPDEVVVLIDSAYGDHKIFNLIQERGWDFVCCLRKNRSVGVTQLCGKNGKNWHSIQESFKIARGSSPFETIRIHLGKEKNKKRKEFRARQLKGFLRKSFFEVSLVYSEKKKGKKAVFLACSNTKIDTRAIVLAYRCRWLIETFHRSVKNNLGFQDAGVTEFDSMVSHVHWVYCAYLLLQENKKRNSLEEKQREIKKEIEGKECKKIIQLSTQFGGRKTIKNYFQTVLNDLEAA